MSSILLLVLVSLAGCTLGLNVQIRTDPPSRPYQAATWIHLACHVENATGRVYYNWTAICGATNPPSVIGRLNDNENHGEFSLKVRSTHTSCLDTIACSANDTTGARAVAIWRIGRVVGAGFFGLRDQIFNNSAIRATAIGEIGIIRCHSSSYISNVGRWISPAGRDITTNPADPFRIRFGSGPNYPSYSSFQLQNTRTGPFLSANQGVYSCTVPDNNGTTQILHIGIYTQGYRGNFKISNVRHISRNPITLDCATTGLPPTAISWYMRGHRLSDGQTYQMSQVLTNRMTSSYSNLLTINRPISRASGVYQCRITSAQQHPIDNSITSVLTEKYFIALYGIGSRDHISCSLGNISNHVWEDQLNNTVAAPRADLQLRVNDSIHGKTYYCRGYATPTSTVVLRQIRLKVIVIIPDNAAVAMATGHHSSPTLGQPYQMTCHATKTISGLMNSPRPQWTDRNGSPVVEGRGISLTESPGRVSLSISSLRTSHAGSYHCRATLTSPALDTPLVNVDTFIIAITIPTPNITVRTIPDQPGPFEPGSTVQFICEATVSRLVDTPISVQFTWKDGNSGNTIVSSEHESITVLPGYGSHSYRSVLTVSSLTEDRALLCEAVIRSSGPITYRTHIRPSGIVVSSRSDVNVRRIPATARPTTPAMHTTHPAEVTDHSVKPTERPTTPAMSTSLPEVTDHSVKPTERPTTPAMSTSLPGSTDHSVKPTEIPTTGAMSTKPPADITDVSVKPTDSSRTTTPTRTVSTTLPESTDHSVTPTEAVCREDIQFSFGEVSNCNQWRFDNAAEKLDDIVSSLVHQMQQQCRECGLTPRGITNRHFSCNVKIPSSVTFHATIVTTENCNKISERILKWAQSGEATLTVSMNRVTVIPDCSLTRIPGKGCSTNGNKDNNQQSIWLYVGIGLGGGGLLVAFVLVIIVIVMVCYICAKKKNTFTKV